MTDHSASSGPLARSGPALDGPSGDEVVVGQGIVKRWGSVTALSGATFTIRRGVTGLLGTNGAGKTTLLGMMLGLHRPTEGTLAVLGLDPVRAGAAVRERVGYSPEHHTLPGRHHRPGLRPPHRRGPRPPAP